jgi:hypothetical protein
MERDFLAESKAFYRGMIADILANSRATGYIYHRSGGHTYVGKGTQEATLTVARLVLANAGATITSLSRVERQLRDAFGA